MRKRPTIDPNSAAAISSPEALRLISNLQERVSRLEGEVFGTGVYPLAPSVTPRRGRSPSLETNELLKRRDQITYWLEQNWPFLSLALRKAVNADQAICAILEARKRIPSVMQSPFYNGPEKYAEALWDFIRSGRFHGSPRNLAGSMAGMPELKWRSSLDICLQHPCELPLARGAWPDHLLRKFPDILRGLKGATTLERVKAVLAKSRTKDATYLYLRKHPEEVYDWLNVGDPASSRNESQR